LTIGIRCAFRSGKARRTALTSAERAHTLVVVGTGIASLEQAADQVAVAAFANAVGVESAGFTKVARLAVGPATVDCGFAPVHTRIAARLASNDTDVCGAEVGLTFAIRLTRRAYGARFGIPARRGPSVCTAELTRVHFGRNENRRRCGRLGRC
jgi:hypothetical protein